MTCRRAQSLLSAYADSELTGGEMLAVRDHLDSCVNCDEEYNSIASLKRLLGSLPYSKPKPDLSHSLAAFGEYNPLALAMFGPKRDMRRAFGWASAEENSRAMQQASGHAAGLACVIGVLGAWFVVAPVALAPVASNIQARHPRLASLLFAAAFSRGTSLPAESEVYGSPESAYGGLDEASFQVNTPPTASAPEPASVSFSSAAVMPTLLPAGLFQDEAPLGYNARGSYHHSRVLTRTQLHIVDFDSMR